MENRYIIYDWPLESSVVYRRLFIIQDFWKLLACLFDVSLDYHGAFTIKYGNMGMFLVKFWKFMSIDS